MTNADTHTLSVPTLTYTHLHTQTSSLLASRPSEHNHSCSTDYSVTSCTRSTCIEMSRPWLIFLPHASAPTTSTRSTSSSGGGDETVECFGRERKVVGREADERNAPSQLETKERPAKGPIAQTWLTLQYTSHTHTHTFIHKHTQSLFIYPILCFFVLLF